MKKIKGIRILTAGIFTIALVLGMILTAQRREVIHAAERELPVIPIHHHASSDDGSDYTEWGYVYFGSYPQSEVKESWTQQNIDDALEQLGRTTGDVWTGGYKYRKIQKSDCNNTTNFGNSEFRYFKWERIKWRVLHNDGEKLLIMADLGLDCEEYNEENGKISLWSQSSIRKWLNNYYGYEDLDRKDSFAADGFYSTAFASEEKKAIFNTHIDNADDKIFLLEYGDIVNGNNGFCTEAARRSKSRWLGVTDYANCVGALRIMANDWTDKGGNWWLRDMKYFNSSYSGNLEWKAYVVYGDGSSSETGTELNDDIVAVSPALYLDITSKEWSVTNDGTSGYGGDKKQAEEEYNKLLQSIQVSLNNHSLILSRNATAVLKASIIPVDLSDRVTISWFSSDANVATVENGNIKAVGNGTATITVGLSNGKSDQCKVTVTNGMVTPTPSYTTEEKQSTRDVQKGQMIADQASNGNYVITSDTSESPTAEYIGAIDGTKNSVKIPQYVVYQGLMYEITSIKTGALKGNKNIKTVTIGKSATKIGDNAFSGCVKLKKVTIGAGVQIIGKNAFKGCKSLTKLTLKTTKLKRVGGSALKGIHAKCQIKVPKAKLKEYQKLFKKKGQKATVKITK